MRVVEVFLPLQLPDKRPQPKTLFAEVRRELIERFGGLTAHSRAPAQGVWEDDSGQPELDNILIIEVIDRNFDRRWWEDYRRSLERRFAQEEVLIRATDTELI